MNFKWHNRHVAINKTTAFNIKKNFKTNKQMNKKNNKDWNDFQTGNDFINNRSGLFKKQDEKNPFWEIVKKRKERRQEKYGKNKIYKPWWNHCVPDHMTDIPGTDRLYGKWHPVSRHALTCHEPDYSWRRHLLRKEQEIQTKGILFKHTWNLPPAVSEFPHPPLSSQKTCLSTAPQKPFFHAKKERWPAQAFSQ